MEAICNRWRLSRIEGGGLLILLLMPLAFLLLDRYARLDIILADAMFDSATRSFPWRHHWLADQFAHRWLKSALVLLGALVVIATVWDAIRPMRRWSPDFRIRLRLLACSAALVPLIISSLKRISVLHCPWDIDRYGGFAPYVRLLDAMPAGFSAGHCFPAGHASSALWLVAIAVFWLPHRPHRACAVGGAMLMFGFALGWLQQMRGAHFLSHTLWSVWLAYAIVALLYAFFIRGEAREHRL